MKSITCPQCKKRMVYQPSQSQHYCADCKKYVSPESALRSFEWDTPESPLNITNITDTDKTKC